MTRSNNTYSKRQGEARKRIALTVDHDLEDWLRGQPNMVRYINALIRQDKEMTWVKDTAAIRGCSTGEVLTELRESSTS